MVAAWIAAGTAHADPVIEATAEADGAVGAAAADVARAQDLGKQQDYVGAVALLLEVAHAQPASHHDCNLSLAYLRAGDPTRAQLWADVAAKRGGVRPPWCTTKLPSQLAAALEGLQPVTLVISPDDAVVEIASLSLRGLDVIWLAPGAHTIDATADGFEPSTTQVAVTDAPTKVSLTLEASVDSGVADAPPPLRTTGEGKDPVKNLQLPPTVLSEGRAQATPESKDSPMTWPGWVAASVGALGLAAGGYFHASALATQNDANMLYPSNPAYAPLVDDFRADRNLAFTGYAVGVTLVAAGAWWVLTHGWRP